MKVPIQMILDVDVPEEQYEMTLAAIKIEIAAFIREDLANTMEDGGIEVSSPIEVTVIS